jgi:hypothetical protein
MPAFFWQEDLLMPYFFSGIPCISSYTCCASPQVSTQPFRFLFTVCYVLLPFFLRVCLI